MIPMMFFEDGGVSLFLGDSRMMSGEVDHVITDPPYSRDVYQRAPTRNHQYNGSPSLEKLAHGDIGMMTPAHIAATAGRIAPNCRRWCVIFSDAESTFIWRHQLMRHGMRYIRTGAWVKPDGMPQFSGDRPAVGMELCTIAHGAAERLRWNGGGKPAMWTHQIAQGVTRPDHPCPKPLSLMVELIEQFTDPGDLIYDPFAGSGTTLVAAKMTGRRAIGVEIDPGYCEVAADRIRYGVAGTRAVRAGQLALEDR